MYTHRPKPVEKVQDQLEIDFWKRVRMFRWIFQLCPHISWVGVCNSLPMRQLKQGSDIDLFIVSKRGRLFTCRLWITLLTQVFGLRRHGQKTHKRFCLSFFVEEGFENLEEIAIKEDIYLARWVKTLEPIAGEWHGYSIFLRKNQGWTQDLVGDLKQNRSNFKARGTVYKFLQFCLSIPTIIFEKPLMKWQLKRARLKSEKLNDKSGTIINKHQLKFHDNDQRHTIRDAWKATISSSSSVKL